MVNVSNEYLEKINSLSKSVYWYGKVTLKDGTEYDFDTSNLSQGQTHIRKELCPNKFGIGGTCSAELKLALMLDYDVDSNTYSLNGLIVNRYDFYEANVTLTFRLFFDDEETTYEDVFLGTYIVTEPTRSRNVLTLTAYDYMQKFIKPCVAELQGNIYNNLLNACTICGVTFGNTQREIIAMTNGTVNLVEYDPKNSIVTWRDAVGYMVGILCANAVIKQDVLYVVPFKQNVDRYVTSGERVSLTLEDYHIGYGVIKSVNLRNNVEDKLSVDDTLLTYNFAANPLIQYQYEAARKPVLTNILNKLRGLNYTPFKAELFNDPSYELGDIIDFSENHAGTSTRCIITSMDISINGHMAVSCDGDDPYLKVAEESANTEYQQSTSGSTGDGVTFYDFVSEEDVTVPEDTETEIVSITYDANGKYRHEFMAEVKIGVTATESSTSTEYTENDVDIFATYYINGQEIITYHPQTSFTDGVFLLHLFYFWVSDLRSTEQTFSVTLTVSGGSLSILKGNNHARILQSGVSYGEYSNRIEYIDILKEPNKVLYQIGETLDYDGLVVVACYEDGHQEDITTLCAYDPQNGSIVTGEVGYINVNVEYEGHHAYFGLDLNPVSEIKVTTPPTKTVYRVGENIDYTGMVITAVFDDGSEIEVTDSCTYAPAEGTTVTAETQSLLVTITYDYYGTKFTEIYDELVLHKLLMIDVTHDPTKEEYFVGENIDLSGVVITAEYTDDTTAVVTTKCKFNPANGTQITNEGSINVTVTYTEDGVKKTATIPLIAQKVIPEELVITPPTKTSYREGESLDLTGCVVTARYNNGTQRDVTSECTFSPANGESLSTSTSVVNVSFTDNGVTLTDTIDLDIITFDGIEVTHDPNKTEYLVGQAIDLTGVVVMTNWSDGTKEDITNNCTYTPGQGDITTLNMSQITVTYERSGQTYTDVISITVEEGEVTLTNLRITTPPDIVDYYIGEELDLTGIVVTAYFSSGRTTVVTDSCVFTPSEGSELSLSVTQLTAAYTYENVTMTDSVDITVKEVDLKYFTYQTDYQNHIIYITGVNQAEMEEDNLTTLKVPIVFEDGNSTFDIVIK